MTIEQTIVQYLYKNKAVTLQNIGTFTISDDVVIPYDADSETIFPEDAISFTYDKHAKEDKNLVDFIVENSKKIKSLAESDLESYIILNNQFINIGKEHIITGLGTLKKAQDGTYVFTQAYSSQVIVKEVSKVVKEKIKQPIDFTSPKKDVGNNNIAKYAIMSLLALLLLGVLGYGGYWIFENFKSNSMENATTKKTSDNANNNTTIKPENATETPPQQTVQTAVTDTNSFYIVIKEFTTKEEAEKRMKKLNEYGNHFVVTTKDSIMHKLKLPFKLPLTDTLRVKDSINVYFGAKGYVELPQ